MKKIFLLLCCLFVIVGCTNNEEQASNEEITKRIEEQGWEFTVITSYSNDLENTNTDEGQREWIAIWFIPSEIMRIEYSFEDTDDLIRVNYNPSLESLNKIIYSDATSSCTYYNDEKDAENSSANICKKEMIEPKREEMEERFDQLLEALDISKERLAEWIEWYCIQEGWINEK